MEMVCLYAKEMVCFISYRKLCKLWICFTVIAITSWLENCRVFM